MHGTNNSTVVRRHALTPVIYGDLQAAYTHFNNELFGGMLPDVVIVFARKPHMLGHYAHDRYSERNGGKRPTQHSELALNPDGFVGADDRKILSTLVHEQAHVWQFFHGKASGNYHNKEWGTRMKALGLYPSNTGAPGGRETGVQMSHYIIGGGPFDESYKRLADSGWTLDIQSTAVAGKRTKKPESKAKFSCPNCGLNAWGKPGLELICLPCLEEVFDIYVVDQPHKARSPLIRLRNAIGEAALMQPAKR